MLTESSKDVIAFLAVIFGGAFLWWVAVFIAYTIMFFRISMHPVCHDEGYACYFMYRAKLEWMNY